MTGTPQVSKAIKKHWRKLKIEAFRVGSGEKEEVLIQFRALDFEPLLSCEGCRFLFFPPHTVLPLLYEVLCGLCFYLCKKRGSQAYQETWIETQNV